MVGYLSTKQTMAAVLLVSICSIARFWKEDVAGFEYERSLHTLAGDMDMRHRGSSLRPISTNAIGYPRVVSFASNNLPLISTYSDYNESQPVLWEMEAPPYDPEDSTRIYGSIDSSDLPHDEPRMEPRIWPLHENDRNCEPMAEWQHLSFPNCNSAHELDFGHRLTTDLSFLSAKGYWRDVWMYNETVRGEASGRPTVWKTLKTFRDMEEAYFENNRVDALAMERLTGSKYVMNIHGYCGMSIVTEYAGTDISKVARHLNMTERLDLAIKVAQGLADVHRVGKEECFDGDATCPVQLVHNDLNLANVVVTLDHRPVLNDFNVAILTMNNRTSGKACEFSSRFPNPQWKAPEEQIVEDSDPQRPPMVSEKIDIYALGNVFFRLAAGRSPWKAKNAVRLTSAEKASVAQRKYFHGELPSMPDELRSTSDPATTVLLTAMKICYSFDPADRPSAEDIVKYLEESRSNIL